MTFPEKLREAREQRRLSQEDLAQLAKVSSDVVSRIERGLVEAKPAHLIAFALAMQTSTDALLGLSGDPQAEGDLADVRRVLKATRRLGPRELNLVAQVAEAFALKGGVP
jgi:transcriptional regulator with XRE-family HTH domain